MKNPPAAFFEEYVFTVSVPKSANSKCKQLADYRKFGGSHPREYPTMDITAVVLVYLNLAANQAPGSGNISTNHSCKTGGNLYTLDNDYIESPVK